MEDPIPREFYVEINHIMYKAYLDASDDENAERCNRKLLFVFHDFGETKLEGRFMLELAIVTSRQRKVEEAKELFESAIRILKATGQRKLEANAYNRAGSLLYSLHKYWKAKEYCEKALAISMEIDDKEGKAGCMENLGAVLRSLGDYQKAREYYEKALAINVEIGDKEGEATCIGNVLSLLGENQKAREYIEKALAISMEIGDKEGEATCIGKLGTVLSSLGEYQKASEYYEKALAISMEIGDKGKEARCIGKIGAELSSLGEYKKAREYLEKALAICMEIGDKEGEECCIGNLGKVSSSLGEYQKAKEYYDKAFAISMEISGKSKEATSFLSLENMFGMLDEDQKAKEYNEKALAIAVVSGRKSEQLRYFLRVGFTYLGLRKYSKAKEYGEKALSITSEIGYQERQADALGILGRVSDYLNDHVMAKKYYEKRLAIGIKIGNRSLIGDSYQSLAGFFLRSGKYDKADEYLEKARVIIFDVGEIRGEVHYLLLLSTLRIKQSRISEALSHLYQCISKYEKLRDFQHGNEQFQQGLLETHGASAYELLSELLCSTGNLRDALYVEELRRARCLTDLMARNLSVENHISADPKSWSGMEEIVNKEHNSVFLYITYSSRIVSLWVLKANGDTVFRQSEKVDDETLMAEGSFDLNSYFNKSIRGFGVLPSQKFEDQSCNETMPILSESEADLRGDQAKDTETMLSVCSKLIIAPVAELLTEPEIIIVPERSLYRVPFAALRDQPGGKYLSETFRLRIVPSLSTLRLIQDCPVDYHSQTGVLVVGNPKVGSAHYRGKIHDFKPLACAEKETEMIGQLLGVQPLLGERATREAILQEISSVSLIHIAAHGNADRGEIALSPSPVTFLASGARSVLVTLWAIEDEATEQFMRRFYRHLVDGFSASECLHQAMKWLRNIGYTKVSQWAPFMLIGDNVTFNFKEERKDELEKE
ncbi:Tetratricopeptide repeat protein 28 [Stylophora pistillata]|uniref:Tetratricopeptide repeat protein 28 n=2 Tax=Stylophora pistillata TaxID=50429 RepID=A0A2B4RKE0_STYPI|nr:Tetratricopeptide repeat protein 28 [Stylophora pistillata]